MQCRDLSDEAGDDEVDAVREPPALRSLKQDWERALAPVAERFGGPDAYLACLDEQDVPALEGRGWKAIDQVFSAARPAPEDVPLPGEPAGAAWQRFLDLERPLVEADWACRSAQFDQAVSDLPAIVESFEAAHADQISALEAHWSAVEDEATALGWSEDRPQAQPTP